MWDHDDAILGSRDLQYLYAPEDKAMSGMLPALPMQTTLYVYKAFTDSCLVLRLNMCAVHVKSS